MSCPYAGAGESYTLSNGVGKPSGVNAWRNNMVPLMKGHKMNTARLAFTIPGYNGGYPVMDFNVLDQVLDVLYANGFVAILDFHNLPGDSSNFRSFIESAAWVDFWRSFAARYKNDPRVYAAEVSNEPDQLGLYSNHWTTAVDYAAYNARFEACMNAIRSEDTAGRLKIIYPFFEWEHVPTLTTNIRNEVNAGRVLIAYHCWYGDAQNPSGDLTYALKYLQMFVNAFGASHIWVGEMGSQGGSSAGSLAWIRGVINYCVPNYIGWNYLEYYEYNDVLDTALSSGCSYVSSPDLTGAVPPPPPSGTYVFDHFEINGVTYTENLLQLTVYEATNVLAVYKKYVAPTPTHTLVVTSIPVTGIPITVDGQAATTPTSPLTLLEGNHIVVVPANVQVGSDIYNFKQWEDESTNPTRTISLTSNMTATATYQLQPPPPPAKGYIEIHAFLDSQEVIAQYEVLGVSVGNTPSTVEASPGTYTVKVTYSGVVQTKSVQVIDGQTIQVNFQYVLPPPTHTLVVTSTPVTKVPITIDGIQHTTPTSPQTLPEGTHTVVAPSNILVDADAYNFKEWEDASTNPTRTVNLTSNRTITATYVLAPPVTHTLTIMAATGGTTDPRAGIYVINEGFSQRVTAIPDPNNRFTSWLKNGSLVTDNPINIIMDAEYTLEPRFEYVPPPPVQATIRGYVKDAVTGIGVAAASLTCDGYAYISQQDGSYVFPNIPAQPYTLKATKEGYLTQSIVIDASGGETILLDLLMQPSPPPTPLSFFPLAPTVVGVVALIGATI